MKKIALVILMTLLLSSISFAATKFPAMDFSIKGNPTTSNLITYGIEWTILRMIDHPDLGCNDVAIDLILGNTTGTWQGTYTSGGIQLLHRFLPSNSNFNPYIGIKAATTKVMILGQEGNVSGYGLFGGIDIKLKAGKLFLQIINYPNNTVAGPNWGGSRGEIGYRFFTD